MRRALSAAALRELYDSAAGRYDRQHALLTARVDQRGRETLVREAVNCGDTVLY